MGQERHTHDGPDARTRIEDIYASYAGDPRKRRAWAPDNPGNRAIRTELEHALLALSDPAAPADARALDVGCGNGYWLTRLQAAGFRSERLAGIDILPTRIEVARAKLPAADLRVAEATSLPFSDGEFELVLMFTVLSSLPDAEVRAAASAEAWRVTRPGGVLAIYEPRVPNPFNTHTRLVTLSELRRTLGPELASRSVTVAPPVMRRLGRATHRLYPFVARVGALRTHRLVWIRKTPTARDRLSLS